jgi:ATP-binding cassette subfamily F protein 3
LMGLATFEGPQLLILDEPTNHLDIDSRAELVEAINDYEGACILISHDRRLLEACAERLWLVADGGVHNFEGDLDDYARLVLGQPAPPKTAPPSLKTAPPARTREVPLSKQIEAVEARMQRFEELLTRIDEELAKAAREGVVSAQAIDLAVKRRELERALLAAEESWLELSARADTAN